MPRYDLHDVFISYRRFEDVERTDDQGTRIANAVFNYLCKKKLAVFLDRHEMETGSWEDQLRWQLEHTPCFIFIGTERARHFLPPDQNAVTCPCSLRTSAVDWAYSTLTASRFCFAAMVAESDSPSVFL